MELRTRTTQGAPVSSAVAADMHELTQVRERALRRFGVSADPSRIDLSNEASVPAPLPGEDSREFVRRLMLAQVEAVEATATYKRAHAGAGAVTLTEEERYFLERGRDELLVALRRGDLPPPNVAGTRYRTWPAFLTGLYAAQVPLYGGSTSAAAR